MTDDRKMMALLAECLAELGDETGDRDRANDALRRLEQARPGTLRTMADGLAMRRSRRATRH